MARTRILPKTKAASRAFLGPNTRQPKPGKETRGQRDTWNGLALILPVSDGFARDSGGWL